MDVPIILAGPIAGALLTAIGILWRRVEKLQDKLSANEQVKLEMVLKEADEAKNLMLQMLKEDQFRLEVRQALNKIENLLNIIERKGDS